MVFSKQNLNIIRKAVRCFYINNNEVICLRTKVSNLKPGFIDIPGGKIEENETMEQAVIREYKEETGLDITKPVFRGIINVVFPKGTYQLNTFIINSYEGELEETEEHVPFIVNIDELIKMGKRFACTVMLEPTFLKVLLDETKTFELTISTSEEEVISSINFEIIEKQ